jgi:hypothetical protein
MSESPGNFWRTLPLYLACYALWIGSSALGVWLLFALRSLLFDLAVRLRFNPWQVRAVDNFGIVTLGMIWLVGILLAEHYLREGVVKHQLWRCAAHVFVFEALALGLVYGLVAVL